MQSGPGHVYYRELLEQHVDGTLSAAERDVLFGHLETCTECRQTLEAEERLTQRLRAVPKLVAPSDLRKRILQQALKENQQRKVAITEDPQFAPILAATPGNSDAPVVPAADSARDDAAEPVEDMPSFPSVPRARPSRLRMAWRRTSPRIASAFVCVAAIAALYTGDFRQLPMLHGTQVVLKRVSAAALNISPPVSDHETPVDDQPAIIAAPIEPAIARPLTNTQLQNLVRNKMRVLQARLDYAKEAFEAFAEVCAVEATAQSTLPAPAENSAPGLAALVLVPRNSGEGLGFQESQLGQAVRSAALTKLAGVIRTDQYAYEGHRYRSYTLEVPVKQAVNVIKALQPYKTLPAEDIRRGVEMQPHENRSGAEPAYYSADASELESVLTALAVPPRETADSVQKLQIILVE